MSFELVCAIVTLAVGVTTLVFKVVSVKEIKVSWQTAVIILLIILLLSVLIARFTENIREPGETEPSVPLETNYTTESTVPSTVKAELEVGDIYAIGKYRQDGKSTDSIEWLVLAVKDDKALLVSDKALSCRRFNEVEVAVIWQNCDLRQWLNEDFYDDAFNEAEKNRILQSEIENGEDRKTQDKVFLLSLEEVEKYLPTNNERICVATDFAVDQNAYVNESTGGSWWWLRSRGDSAKTAVSINSTGVIDRNSSVTGDRGTVRPAIWISLG